MRLASQISDDLWCERREGKQDCDYYCSNKHNFLNTAFAKVGTVGISASECCSKSCFVLLKQDGSDHENREGDLNPWEYRDKTRHIGVP